MSAVIYDLCFITERLIIIWKIIFKKPSQFYTIADIDGRTLCLYHNLSELSDHASSKYQRPCFTANCECWMWSYLIVFHKIWEKGVFIIFTPTQLTIQHLPELVMQHIKKCLTRIYLKHVGERFSCGFPCLWWIHKGRN